ncbi:MAG: helix-turn-helix transcriptional regulator, partial [Kiritimatiellae bacterium]|nr:helix-turn-helix transcriptional regulator [Kiritimatiellia bacterium]
MSCTTISAHSLPSAPHPSCSQSRWTLRFPFFREDSAYINENLSADLSVDLLAEKVYLSRYHFMRLFKMQTGSTVHSYIR